MCWPFSFAHKNTPLGYERDEHAREQQLLRVAHNRRTAKAIAKVNSDTYWRCCAVVVVAFK